MLIFIYLFISLYLPTESSLTNNGNLKNAFASYMNSRADLSKKDPNNLKIVSHEPFIIQLEMPKAPENGNAKTAKEKKRKRPAKKRISKLKLPRHRFRSRRYAEPLDIIDILKESGSKMKESAKNISDDTTILKEDFQQNNINRHEMIKVLIENMNKTKREVLEENKHFNESTSKENDSKNLVDWLKEKIYNKQGDTKKPHPTNTTTFVKMRNPNTPKTDKLLPKYLYKDLIADRERLEKKIKNLKIMLSANDTALSPREAAVRVRRKTESDRVANKIARMFLTLSAVTGLNDKKKSKCKDDEDEYEDGGIWEEERRSLPVRKTSSSNEERYKIKKWIEHLKGKRSSGRTCPCRMNYYDDADSDSFPLERKYLAGFTSSENDRSSEESFETLKGTRHYPKRDHSLRGKVSKDENPRIRYRKISEDPSSIFGKRGRRKFEIPLEDLEQYRTIAKQILQNAEEILDKIKDDEEKRRTVPNHLVNHLRELTSRIQSDPRSNENELIKMLQKHLTSKSLTKEPEESKDKKIFTNGNKTHKVDTHGKVKAPTEENKEKHSFTDGIKSYILDPYEKAKALTEESAKKLSQYLLRNLGKGEGFSDEVYDSKPDYGESPDDRAKETPLMYQKLQSVDKTMDSGNLQKEIETKPDLAKEAAPKKTADPANQVNEHPNEGGKVLEDAKKPTLLKDPFTKKVEEMLKEQEGQIKQFIKDETKESEDSRNVDDLLEELLNRSSDSTKDNGSKSAADDSDQGQAESAKTDTNSEKPLAAQKDANVGDAESKKDEEEVSGYGTSLTDEKNDKLVGAEKPDKNEPIVKGVEENNQEKMTGNVNDSNADVQDKKDSLVKTSEIPKTNADPSEEASQREREENEVIASEHLRSDQKPTEDANTEMSQNGLEVIESPTLKPQQDNLEKERRGGKNTGDEMNIKELEPGQVNTQMFDNPDEKDIISTYFKSTDALESGEKENGEGIKENVYTASESLSATDKPKENLVEEATPEVKSDKELSSTVDEVASAEKSNSEDSNSTGNDAQGSKQILRSNENPNDQSKVGMKSGKNSKEVETLESDSEGENVEKQNLNAEFKNVEGRESDENIHESDKSKSKNSEKNPDEKDNAESDNIPGVIEMVEVPNVRKGTEDKNVEGDESHSSAEILKKDFNHDNQQPIENAEQDGDSVVRLFEVSRGSSSKEELVNENLIKDDNETSSTTKPGKGEDVGENVQQEKDGKPTKDLSSEEPSEDKTGDTNTQDNVAAPKSESGERQSESLGYDGTDENPTFVATPEDSKQDTKRERLDEENDGKNLPGVTEEGDDDETVQTGAIKKEENEVSNNKINQKEDSENDEDVLQEMKPVKGMEKDKNLEVDDDATPNALKPSKDFGNDDSEDSLREAKPVDVLKHEDDNREESDSENSLKEENPDDDLGNEEEERSEENLTKDGMALNNLNVGDVKDGSFDESLLKEGKSVEERGDDDEDVRNAAGKFAKDLNNDEDVGNAAEGKPDKDVSEEDVGRDKEGKFAKDSDDDEEVGNEKEEKSTKDLDDDEEVGNEKEGKSTKDLDDDDERTPAINLADEVTGNKREEHDENENMGSEKEKTDNENLLKEGLSDKELDEDAGKEKERNHENAMKGGKTVAELDDEAVGDKENVVENPKEGKSIEELDDEDAGTEKEERGDENLLKEGKPVKDLDEEESAKERSDENLLKEGKPAEDLDEEESAKERSDENLVKEGKSAEDLDEEESAKERSDENLVKEGKYVKELEDEENGTNDIEGRDDESLLKEGKLVKELEDEDVGTEKEEKDDENVLKEKKPVEDLEEEESAKEKSDENLVKEGKSAEEFEDEESLLKEGKFAKELEEEDAADDVEGRDEESLQKEGKLSKDLDDDVSNEKEEKEDENLLKEGKPVKDLDGEDVVNDTKDKRIKDLDEEEGTENDESLVKAGKMVNEDEEKKRREDENFLQEARSAEDLDNEVGSKKDEKDDESLIKEAKPAKYLDKEEDTDDTIFSKEGKTVKDENEEGGGNDKERDNENLVEEKPVKDVDKEDTADDLEDTDNKILLKNEKPVKNENEDVGKDKEERDDENLVGGKSVKDSDEDVGNEKERNSAKDLKGEDVIAGKNYENLLEEKPLKNLNNDEDVGNEKEEKSDDYLQKEEKPVADLEDGESAGNDVEEIDGKRLIQEKHTKQLNDEEVGSEKEENDVDNPQKKAKPTEGTNNEDLSKENSNEGSGSRTPTKATKPTNNLKAGSLRQGNLDDERIEDLSKENENDSPPVASQPTKAFDENQSRSENDISEKPSEPSEGLYNDKDPYNTMIDEDTVLKLVDEDKAENIMEENADERRFDDDLIRAANQVKNENSKELNSNPWNNYDQLRNEELYIPVDQENLQSIDTKPKQVIIKKTPISIEKIIKDLEEGKVKDDIPSMQELDPERIDHLIHKIDEVEEKNAPQEVDCVKECRCADEIDKRARTKGRSELLKDFLYWMKDLRLNRVLSDD